jgi:hypothetical protein
MFVVNFLKSYVGFAEFMGVKKANAAGEFPAAIEKAVFRGILRL